MNKRIIWGGVAAILLLAAGALTVAILWPSAAAVAQESEGAAGGQRVMVIAVEEVINGEVTAGEVRVTFADPPELPAAAAAVSGLYLGQAGDTLTVGTGPVEVEIGVEQVNDEEPKVVVNASHGGDQVPVVITAGTIFYEDTTARPQITAADIEAGAITVQGTVVPGSASDLVANMLVRAWGNMEGGRLIADVLLYETIR